MKKRETPSRGEELLAQVVEECLDEDLSFVPPEREIARTHRFSKGFEDAMARILEDTTKNVREQDVKKHFSPRYGQWAACVLVFCLCSGLFYYVIGPSVEKGAPAEQAADTGIVETAEATVEESAAEAAPEAPAAGIPESAPAKEQDGTGEQEEALTTESAAEDKKAQKEKLYCGQTVYPAEQQEVPETLDYVTTLVNCPVLDEKNPVLYLTIGNIGEEPVRYWNRYDLEVWLEDGWYLIPPEADGTGEWLTLEEGMALDEEIDLSGYRIDYGAQRYRLVACVNEERISAEFTFDEVFTETMEKLEEEEASGE